MPAASPTAAKEKSNSVSPLVAAFAFAENSCLDFQLSGAPRIGESSSLSSTSRWACSYYTYETASALSVATYYRDSTTGLDYAQNRYYASTLGRFISPDPYKSGVGSGDPAHPQTWNRYAYVVGDPINGYDPTGKDCELVDNGSGNFVLNCSPPPDPGSGGDDGSDVSHQQPGVNRQGYTLQQIVALGIAEKSKKVAATLTNLRRSIDQDCLAWLESGIAGGLTSVFNQFFNALIGVPGGAPAAGAANLNTSSGQGPNAAEGPIGTGYSITVNAYGAFFDPSVGVGVGKVYDSQISQLVGGTQSAQNFILLHELAHYFQVPGFIKNDYNLNDPTNLNSQRLNNDQVWKNCSKTIGGGGVL